MKTPTEIATSLEFFNEWRRKDEFITTKMPDPYKVGHDIDMAVMLLREHDATIAERDQLRAENGSEKNLHAQTRTVVGELNTICNDLRVRAERAEAELAAERARLRQVALDAVKSAQIKPMVWYPKGYFVNPNDLGKINEHQVEACVAAIDAAMQEGAK
jgi:hypothetical protein